MASKITYLTLISLILITSLGHADSYNKRDNFIIAMDIGHSQKRSGAVSARGTNEYLFNKRMVIEIYQRLRRHGYTRSFIISEDGTDMSLNERINRAGEKGTHLLISIHHDSVQKHYLASWKYNENRLVYCDKYQGYSIFYSNKNKKPQESLLFATSLGSALKKEGLSPSLHHAEKIKGENRELVDLNRGIYKYDNLGILKSQMVAILLECGIIVNRDEEDLLNDKRYREKIVRAVVNSIDTFSNPDQLYLNQPTAIFR